MYKTPTPVYVVGQWIQFVLNSLLLSVLIGFFIVFTVYTTYGTNVVVTNPVTIVSVDNFPTKFDVNVTNPVTTVSVDNFPEPVDLNVTVLNPVTTVSVDNFPASESVRVTNNPAGVVTDRPIVKRVFKFGRSSAILSGTDIVLSGDGGTYNGFFTTPQTVRVAAGGNANDDISGTGGRTLRVIGLDANFDELEEDINLAGISASASTVNSFIRVNRCFLTASGTYSSGLTGANIADITLETTSGTTITDIKAGAGQSQIAIYTIPRNYTGLLVGGGFSSDSDVQFKLWSRENADITSAPYPPKRLQQEVITTADYHSVQFQVFREISAKTDIWVTAAKLTGGTAQANAEFQLWLYDNV